MRAKKQEPLRPFAWLTVLAEAHARHFPPDNLVSFIVDNGPGPPAMEVEKAMLKAAFKAAMAIAPKGVV